MALTMIHSRYTSMKTRLRRISAWLSRFETENGPCLSGFRQTFRVDRGWRGPFELAVDRFPNASMPHH